MLVLNFLSLLAYTANSLAHYGMQQAHNTVSLMCYSLSKTVAVNLLLCFRILLVKRFIDEDCLPHLLFYGPPGTGKTSTILACAQMLYPQKELNSMILEVQQHVFLLVYSTCIN